MPPSREDREPVCLLRDNDLLMIESVSKAQRIVKRTLRKRQRFSDQAAEPQVAGYTRLAQWDDASELRACRGEVKTYSTKETSKQSQSTDSASPTVGKACENAHPTRNKGKKDIRDVDTDIAVETTLVEQQAANNAADIETGESKTGRKRRRGRRRRGRQVQDYATLPPLKHLPEAGMTIAFKMLELGPDYSPIMSAYKEGTVTSFDRESQRIVVRLCPQSASARLSRPIGRFDLEEECAQDEPAIPVSDEVRSSHCYTPGGWHECGVPYRWIPSYRCWSMSAKYQLPPNARSRSRSRKEGRSTSLYGKSLSSSASPTAPTIIASGRTIV